MDSSLQTLSEEPVIATPINVRSTSMVVLMVIGITASLYVARAFFAPLVLGLLISYAMYPIVSFLDRYARIPRPLGAGLIVMLLVTASGYAIIALQSQVVELIEKVPAALEELSTTEHISSVSDQSVLAKLSNAASQIEEAANKAALSVSNPDPTSEEITHTADDGKTQNDSEVQMSAKVGFPIDSRSDQQTISASASPFESATDSPVRVVIDRGAGQYMNYVLDGSFGFLLFFGQALTVLLLVYFALASGDLYKHKLVRISGDTLSEKKVTVQILEQINRQMRLFLFVTLIGALFVGVLTGVVFWWLEMEQAILWGVIAGTASVVPYVGPAFVFAASCLTAFLQFGSLGPALIIATASLIITSIQGNLLTPWLTSRAASMNAIAIFISLLFWGWLWGPVGLIVATPILMVVKSVCDHVENLQGVGEIVSDERSRPTEP